MSYLRQVVAFVSFMAVAGAAAAQERMSFERIALDALASDTQATPGGTDDSYVALVWWIPFEYWAVAFSREEGMSPRERQEVIDVLRDYSLLAVVQADIQALGTFRFYELDAVAESLEITLETGGRSKRIQPLDEVSPGLQPLLGALKPILASAMGNLGSNMHFFVLADRTDANERVIDPYEVNTLRIGLEKRDGERLNVVLETPINSLFVPRTCPNGKPAHVSWKFCPWGGERL
jgi:hypothetical protein